MHPVTDADRKAAEELRVLLADLTGFWHVPGDDGPLCRALSQHRQRAEHELMERLARSVVTPLPAPRDAKKIAAALAA